MDFVFLLETVAIMNQDDPVKNPKTTLWLFLILVLLNAGLVAYLLLFQDSNTKPRKTSYPYYFIDRLEEAIKIQSPVFSQMGEDPSLKPFALTNKTVQEKIGHTLFKTSHSQGRKGYGQLTIREKTKTAPHAQACFNLPLKGGRTYKVSGYLKYDILGDLASFDLKKKKIPKAFLTWQSLPSPPAKPILRFSKEKLESENRSKDLLDVMMHWRVSRRLFDWNYFEVSIEAPPEAKGIGIVFECENLFGETIFSDLMVTPLDFCGRVLYEGSYRYLPTVEYLFPLKKMFLIDDFYRTSLLAFPDSCFVYDLDLPKKPALQFYLSLVTDDGLKKPVKIRFEVSAQFDGAPNKISLFNKILSSSEESGWGFESLDLFQYAGRKARLFFETSYENMDQTPLRPRVAPLWGTPVLFNKQAHKHRPNILLLSIDCLREDHLSAHGYARDCAPFLNQLAQQGADFINAYTPADLTYVVMPMVMTGRMIKYDWLGAFNVMDDGVRTLPEVLKEQGYLVGGFCADYYYNGFWKGFPFRPCLEGINPLEQDQILLDEAFEFFKNSQGAPLFAWVHLNGPHPPCEGLPPDNMYVQDPNLLNSIKEEASKHKETTVWDALSLQIKQTDNKQALLNLANALYDGRILRTDRLVQKFMNDLEKEGALDPGYVVVFSDHGLQIRTESIYSRGPLEEGLRVPFIFKGPNIPKKKIRSRVSTLDLAPTLLNILQISAPNEVTGNNLWQSIQTNGALAQTPVFSMPNKAICVWFDQYKYQINKRELEILAKSDGDLDGLPLASEKLFQLPPEGEGDNLDLHLKRPKILLKGRQLLVERWRSLDASVAKGPVNQALVGFFKKAGYMK